MDEQIIAFISKHDNEGEELSLYDEDKFTNPLCLGSYQYDEAIPKRLLLTKHLKIRIGGNSFRVGGGIRSMAKALGKEDKILDYDALFKDEQFTWGSPLIDYDDRLDFRNLQGNDITLHHNISLSHRVFL